MHTVRLAVAALLCVTSAVTSAASALADSDSPAEQGVDGTAQAGDYFAHAVVTGDFNADGVDDVAFGVPEEALGAGLQHAGAVNVLYGTTTGLGTTAPADQYWSQDASGVEGSAAASEEFGAALAVGDFNGDGSDDLAVGVLQDDVGAVRAAGGVNVIYGSASAGLSTTAALPDQLWNQNSRGVEDHAETVDNFGYQLAAGDFDGDGTDDLAVGVNESLRHFDDAGAVNVLYGSVVKGLSTTATRADQLWTQDSPDVDGEASSHEFFNTVTAGDFNGDGMADLAVGVTEDNVPGVGWGTGGENVIYGSSVGLSATATLPDQYWTQDSDAVEGEAHEADNFGEHTTGAGDFNGDGFDDLAIAAPGDRVAGARSAGAVNVIYGSAAGLSTTAALPDQLWSQDSPGIDGQAEGHDRFGTLVTGDFDGDGADDLAVGTFWEDLGDLYNAGAVNILYGSTAAGLTATGSQLWTQDSADVDGTAEAKDWFGYAVGAGDLDGDGTADLVVGVPYEDVTDRADAGAANVLYGSEGAGLSATATRPDQLWTQDSP